MRGKVARGNVAAWYCRRGNVRAAVSWNLDAERSFGKFRNISNKHRAKLDIDSIKKYSLLYFNGDFGGFDNY
jgi:ribosomal protein L35AE/L33A